MLNTESEILKNLKDSDLVVDIGGGLRPFHRANYVLDFNDFDAQPKSERKPHYDRSTWIKHDVCDRKGFPFPDKHFDYSICTHLLEDVRDPLFVCSEIMRVSKRGYIETPSREMESALGIQSFAFTGYMHHRWFVEQENNGLVFTFKSPMLSQLPALQCPRPKKEFLAFHWDNSFTFTERIFFHASEIVDDLTRFRLSVAPSAEEKAKISHAVDATFRGHQTAKSFRERAVHAVARKAQALFVRCYQ